MQDVWKVMSPYLCFDYQTYIKMKQNIKYSSECVLCFCTPLSYVLCLLFNTTLPVLNKLFEPIAAEFFRLFLKPFSCCSWKCFITREMNSFEMFLESCKQWEVQQCQIWAVGRVWNNFKFSALYCHWSGNTSVGSSVNMLKKQWLFPPMNVSDLFFQPL